MTQRTLEKMQRAMKALEIAQRSLANDVLACKTQTEREDFNKDYMKVIDAMEILRSVIGKAETEIYLRNQPSIEQLLGIEEA